MVPAGDVTALNPALDLLFIPIFDKIAYPVWTRLRGGVSPPPLLRMTCGMGFTVLSLATAAIVQRWVTVSPGTVHVAWQIPQYALLSWYGSVNGVWV